MELTGPADPLLIRGAVVVVVAAAAAHGTDPAGDSEDAAVTIVLEASARLAGADAIAGVEVNVRTSGPAVAERCRRGGGGRVD